MINGIINVYKEKGYTSHDVVAKLRGILRQKKIGHTGTLDPEAEGVLPVCLGKATKVCGLLTEKDKVYEAVLLLGRTTDTQDITGTILEEKDAACSVEQVQAVLKMFEGAQTQIPPMYSALKVNGKKLCDLARAGIEVERKPREITVFSIQIKEIALPRVRMEIHCSKGTYIRTLCHDMGQALGCGGCMESLIRTKAAGFELKDAVKLEEIEARVRAVRERAPQKELYREDLQEFVKNTDWVFLQYPSASVNARFSKFLYNGNSLKPEWLTEWNKEYKQAVLRLYDENQSFAGIYQWDEMRREVKPIRIFLE